MTPTQISAIFAAALSLVEFDPDWGPSIVVDGDAIEIRLSSTDAGEMAGAKFYLDMSVGKLFVVEAHGSKGALWDFRGEEDPSGSYVTVGEVVDRCLAFAEGA